MMNDLISRQDAIETVRKAKNLYQAHKMLIQLPSVDAVPVVHGYWKEDPGVGCFWICSACGYPSEAFAANVLYKYCPRCGAKMEVDAGADD